MLRLRKMVLKVSKGVNEAMQQASSHTQRNASLEKSVQERQTPRPQKGAGVTCGWSSAAAAAAATALGKGGQKFRAAAAFHEAEKCFPP